MPFENVVETPERLLPKFHTAEMTDNFSSFILLAQTLT